MSSSDGARVAEMDDRSTDDSEHSVDEPRKRRTLSTTEDNPEDDVRAEAKSNRKVCLYNAVCPADCRGSFVRLPT
jgi:hypothetical protein